MKPENLREFMASNSLKVADVMSLLYVSERTVYQWLSGGRSMPRACEELLVIKTEDIRHANT